MTQTQTVTAIFAVPVQYVISTSSSPTAGGTTAGGGTFSAGANVTVTASSAPGYTFVNWMESGSVVSVNRNYTFQVSVSRSLVARFNLQQTTLSISTTALPPATVGTGYAQGVAATGGTTPYNWSVSSGLPPGLSVNATVGSIFGTPTTAGTFNFTVTVRDAGSPQQTASRALSLTVTSSGGCGDERDKIILEYVTYHVNLAPTCSSFTQSARSANFSFAELNVGSPYSWAIIRTPLTTPASSGYGLERWRANAGGVPRIVNSAYRPPAHNATVSGASQSRHMFGDAVDLRNVSRTQTEYTFMAQAAIDAGASYVEPISMSGVGHIHADWRNR
jgi:hypothetical protein